MMLQNHPHTLGFARALWAIILALLAFPTAARAQVNDWISTISGNWDTAANWSAGLPNASQSEVRIINPNSKAVAILPSTPINFPGSMAVQNLRVGGVAPDSNLLLLNYFGTATPLRVLNNLNVESNGRVLMLYSGLNTSNVNVNGVFDQEGGELTFTNAPASTMQIEGGNFDLTNGLVTGKNMFLGGTNDGFVNASGLVHLDWLGIGSKPTFPNTSNGNYTLQSGWLIADVHESVGETGFGTLAQNDGTNSSPDIAVGNGSYVKTGGGLFAGELRLVAPSLPIFAPPSAMMTHAGGTAMITNDLRLVGQGSRSNPRSATFYMTGGSLSAHRILLETMGIFNQSSGMVQVASTLLMQDNGSVPSTYYLSGGKLFTSETSISSFYPESSGFGQSGGTHIVTNTLWINGVAIYTFSGGTVSAANINLTGNLSQPPQFFIVGAPPFSITNQSVSSQGGAIVIEDSAQAFGRLTMASDSGINLAGSSAILRFGDSHTNSWASQLSGVIPRLVVYGWGGSTNGGGTDQLVFGSSSSGLTSNQLSQIHFIDPTGFAAETYPARILATGEVVPKPRPVLSAQNNKTNLVLSWPGNFSLQSATNATGPYLDLSGASSPYTVNVHQSPRQFFRLRD